MKKKLLVFLATGLSLLLMLNVGASPQIITNITAVAPLDNIWSKGTNNTILFQFYYNASYTGTANCTLWIDNSSTLGASYLPFGNFTMAQNMTTSSLYANMTLTEGNLTWFVNCTLNDSGPYQSNVTATRYLFIDRTAPATNLENFPPDNIWTSNTTINFEFNVTDVWGNQSYRNTTSDLLNCTLYMNGVNMSTNHTLGNSTGINAKLTAYLTSRTLTDANYTWYVNCSDIAGNMNMSAWRNIVQDDTAPTVRARDPADNAVYTAEYDAGQATVLFYFTPSDNLDLKNVTCNITIDSRLSLQNVSTNGTNNTERVSRHKLTFAPHDWRIRCKDLAHNIYKSPSYRTYVEVDEGPGDKYVICNVGYRSKDGECVPVTTIPTGEGATQPTKPSGIFAGFLPDIGGFELDIDPVIAFIVVFLIIGGAVGIKLSQE